MSTFYNGVQFTQNGNLYTSSSCQINSTYFQVSNSTSVNDCASQCASAKQPFTTLANSQNNYMCAAFTFNQNIQQCFLYDRSISTLSVISNSMSCGFYLNYNRYCADNSQRITCNTPNFSSKSVNSQTTAYHGLTFTLKNNFYVSQGVAINEMHYAYNTAQNENDCIMQCQNMFDCTGYDYVLSGVDKGYCYLFDRSIEDLSLAVNPDKNTGFILSRIPECYNDGKSITCGPPQPSSSNSPNISTNSTGPNTSPGSTLQDSSTSSNSTPLILEIMIPIAVVVLVLVGAIFYYQQRLSKSKNNFQPNAKHNEGYPQSQYSGSVNGISSVYERYSQPTEETLITFSDPQYQGANPNQSPLQYAPSIPNQSPLQYMPSIPNQSSILLPSQSPLLYQTQSPIPPSFPSPQPPRIDFAHQNTITANRYSFTNADSSYIQPPLLLKQDNAE